MFKNCVLIDIQIEKTDKFVSEVKSEMKQKEKAEEVPWNEWKHNIWVLKYLIPLPQIKHDWQEEIYSSGEHSGEPHSDRVEIMLKAWRLIKFSCLRMGTPSQ